ncbi:MAG: ribonuclease HII [Burkholderiales bacterium]|nr:ribonuclease HII [Burkholderiales bacterium]
MRRRALVCGVDEAGRGPLAGEVVAACVILDPRRPIDGLADSKQLSAAQREALAACIRADALAWAVASATVAEIDRLNILQASLLAMQRALDSLCMEATAVLVDGLYVPKNAPPGARAVVQGDVTVPAISAASILAKCTRDASMVTLHAQCPRYGFDRHKGYGTADHLQALREHGPSEHHRRSFAPVRDILAQGRLF